MARRQSNYERDYKRAAIAEALRAGASEGLARSQFGVGGSTIASIKHEFGIGAAPKEQRVTVKDERAAEVIETARRAVSDRLHDTWSSLSKVNELPDADKDMIRRLNAETGRQENARYGYGVVYYAKVYGTDLDEARALIETDSELRDRYL